MLDARRVVRRASVSPVREMAAARWSDLAAPVLAGDLG